MEGATLHKALAEALAALERVKEEEEKEEEEEGKEEEKERGKLGSVAFAFDRGITRVLKVRFKWRGRNKASRTSKRAIGTLIPSLPPSLPLSLPLFRATLPGASFAFPLNRKPWSASVSCCWSCSKACRLSPSM